MDDLPMMISSGASTRENPQMAKSPTRSTSIVNSVKTCDLFRKLLSPSSTSKIPLLPFRSSSSSSFAGVGLVFDDPATSFRRRVLSKTSELS